MKVLAATMTLTLKGFWLGCLVLAFGQNLQAAPPCHEMVQVKSSCDILCVVSTEVLNQEIADAPTSDQLVLTVPLSVLEVIRSPLLFSLLSPVHTKFNRGPPEQIVWFTDTIRLRL